jgi:hypothetical protein
LIQEIQLDEANFVLLSASAPELEPTSFKDAWNHPDPKNSELWRIAINKESGEINKKVWEVINKEDVHDGRRTINVSGFLTSKETAYFKLDWLPSITISFLELILMRVCPCHQ